MTRYLYLFLLSTFILFTCWTSAGHCASAQENQVVDIRVDVHKMGPKETFNPYSLLKRLKTKIGCIFSQIDFDADLKMLASEYDHVEPHLSFEEKGIVITLELTPKSIIRHICWHGNHRIPSCDLMEELDIKLHTVFDRYIFNEAFHKLRAYYIKEGFFEAELNYVVHHNPNCNDVTIDVYINEGPAGRIKKICFVGFTECEEESIMECLITKEYCWFSSWMTGSGTYQPEALEHDKLRILNSLQNEGYADARIEVKVSEADCNDRIAITFIACRGELYRFGKVTFCGNKLFCDEDIHEHICVHEGACYSPEKLRETIEALTNHYGAKGYIESCIRFNTHLCEKSNTYDVHFEIHEGEQFRIGLVKVFGNVYTKTSVILHESLMCPGEIFDIRRVKATECRLQNVGYFECVNVYPVRSTHKFDDCEHYRDVHIEVKETCTGNISLSTGYSTLESLFGAIELSERNFNHLGLWEMWGDKGPIALRGNGEFLRMRAEIGTKTSAYLLAWTKPYFMDTNWIVGFSVDRTRNRNLSNDYDVETTGFKLDGTYAINNFWRFGVHYRFQNSQLAIDNRQLINQLSEATIHGVVSAIGPALYYDTTDHPCMPTRGLRSYLSAELAGLGGQYTFWSLSYCNSYYVKICNNGVLKYRLDARFLQPFGSTSPINLPLAERYFLGGDTTVRGYRGYSIGPKFPGTEDPRGGVSSLLISQEYLHHICKNIDGFVFMDGGSVSLKAFDIDTMRYSYGVGLRLEILGNAPVILGYGWPINPQSPSDVRRFFICAGGNF